MEKRVPRILMGKPGLCGHDRGIMLVIMALRDAGRLDLDDRLDAHLPEVAHGALTIRRMLGHLSGLQREPVGRVWETFDNPDATRLLAELAAAEQVLAPHEVFHYSNLAFALLGQVIERLEGRRIDRVRYTPRREPAEGDA